MDTAIAFSSASELSTDPVSSLRAAALSTLKAKRRKPPPVALPARPPPPTEAFHLDYGADDGLQDVAMTDPKVLPTPALPTTPSSPVERLPDQQAREEGEISEEDEPPPANSFVKATLRARSPTPKGIAPEPRPSLEAERPRQTTPFRKETTPLAKSVILPDSSRSPLSAISSISDVPMEGVVLTEPHLVLSPLGLDHIRPGLQLTQDQFDTIKDIVLDLLGWGVPPAYLVDCVSREAVFYVFSELNLALPEDFDASGIIPYRPDLLPQWQRLTAMTDTLGGSKGKRSPPATHSVGLPTATVSSAPDSSLSLDLHDIERQRRQELVARKAAQASRKMRQSISLGSSNASSTTKESLTVTPPSSTEAVDEFLNSIGPVDLGISNRTKSISSDDMDIYDAPMYPGPEPHVRRLSTSSGSTRTPLRDTVAIVDAIPPINDSTILANVRSATNQPPPSSSSSSAFSQSDSDAISTAPRLEHSDFRSHRGLKRAVASDFDFDAVPRRNGLMNPPAKQSKTAFVAIASKRCVIDLSDSEAEDDSFHYSPHTPGVNQVITKPDRKGKSGSISSPKAAKPSTPSGVATPSALLQKELEIQKMRELIARREEETRLKKLAAKISSTNTPSNEDAIGPNIIQPQPHRLKVEETDIIMSAGFPLMNTIETELVTRRSSESASPPAEISEASMPVTRSVTQSPIVKSSIQDVGDQDLASTPRETQVQPELSTNVPPFMFSMVDLDMFPSSSAQMNRSPTIAPASPKQAERDPPLSEALLEQPNHSDLQPGFEYTNYFSPFDFYPLLRSHSSTSDSLYMHTSSIASDFHSSPAPVASSWPRISPSLVPDLKPLRLAVLSKRLDPSKRLCQYESGGGTCRDSGCEDLHLNRLQGMNSSGQLEPTDEDTANFLFSVLPHRWLSTYQVHSPHRILDALQEAQQPSKDLDEKVANAIAIIGSFPPPTSS